MGLTARKEKILQAVIDNYITTAVPVSSKELSEKHMPQLSSATIRNELSALEEMGYLMQPHTSSGRVPTAEAYKLYVDKLMPRRKLTRPELNVIKKYFNSQVGEIEDVLKKTAKVLSEITNYTSVTLMPKIRDALVKNIKFVSLDAYSMLVVIVTDSGVIKDTVVELDESLPEDYFDAAAKLISKVFYNRPLYEILNPENAVNEEIDRYKAFFAYVTEILEHYFADEDTAGGGRVILEGSSKLLEYPEYSDVSKAKTLFQVLDAREKLYPLLRDANEMDFSVKIGNAGGEGLQDCAIVTAKYSIDGREVGTQGVIGPIRMDYPLVISVLDSIGKVISSLPVHKGQLKDIDIDGKDNNASGTSKFQTDENGGIDE